MHPYDVIHWRGRRSQKQAGSDIGRSERQIRDYEAGRATVPRTVELAMCADWHGFYKWYGLKTDLDSQRDIS